MAQSSYSTRVRLPFPRLTSARLTSARLTSARLTSARLTSARLASALLASAALAMSLPAQGRQVVYVAPVHGMIDMGVAPFIQRVLDQATADGAAAVVLDINTLGGRLDAAIAIRDALLDSKVQVVAFINRRAISAGALIALAAHRIAITDGGTIGAATPVQIGQPGEQATPVAEKTVSYVRKEFRATADSRKRPATVAEAMVDADLEIPGLIDKGKLLTLTTEEALAQGIADFRANDLTALLAAIDMDGAEIRHARVNWAERLVRLLTHPVVSSLLLSVAMIGILVELRTPGFGIPGIVGLTSLVLFLGGHWLVELAGWEELLLVGVGLVLLALEIFVIPGFGIAGVTGIAALLAGLTLSLLGAGSTPMIIARSVGRVTLSMAAAAIASLVLMRFLPRLPGGSRLVLETGLGADEGFASPPESDRQWLGKTGRTQSALRPAGIATIEGERVDVISDGEMIEPGTEVIVTRVDGNRVVVRRLATVTPGAHR
jgi:membrane-bound serine protease (ClpP class)